jgi:alanyl-tRNA synthetase
MKFTTNEIRQKFLDFMETKGHYITESAPLIPENDASVLFNVAGMQPMVPYLLGEVHPKGKRIANSQKCVRTNDIEEVGDDTHLTFFEMLGNWSLGDFFKEESIAWSYEFLTSSEWLALDPKYIAVTVFEGDQDAPRDEEAADIWKKVGMPEQRISYLDKAENWWAAGDTGPCGPDSEIFYWVGEGEPTAQSNVAHDEDNWMEIWNNVFMEYIRDAEGNLSALPNKNIDTGMGLERITATLNGVKSVYETDAFSDVLLKIKELVGEENYNEKWARIIADHVRMWTHIIADGIVPNNMDQGYVLRRLLRRSIREAYKMNYEENILVAVSKLFVEKFRDVYSSIKINEEKIYSELQKEEEKFAKTLKSGLKEFDKLLKGFQIAFERSGKKIDTIAGPKAFKLYDTFGFPLEMTVELATEQWMKVDEEWFNKAFEEHQEKSRAGSEKKFAWGLADDGVETTQLHTATHLLLAGLNHVLGWDVHQKGSNITPERLRFDFNADGKVQRDILDKVEEFVNEAITDETSIVMSEMSKQQAIDEGVEGSFWEKYPDVVKVYSMTGKSGKVYSRELCGGPHVETTAGMWTFKIKKEEASSSGVRRIKAVLIK